MAKKLDITLLFSDVKIIKQFLAQELQKAVKAERVRSAFIVEEMMEDSEYWQPIAGRILGRTIIKKEDIINLIKKEL
jgi:hypothetical protein